MVNVIIEQGQVGHHDKCYHCTSQYGHHGKCHHDISVTPVKPGTLPLQ